MSTGSGTQRVLIKTCPTTCQLCDLTKFPSWRSLSFLICTPSSALLRVVRIHETMYRQCFTGCVGHGRSITNVVVLVVFITKGPSVHKDSLLPGLHIYLFPLSRTLSRALCPGHSCSSSDLGLQRTTARNLPFPARPRGAVPTTISHASDLILLWSRYPVSNCLFACLHPPPRSRAPALCGNSINICLHLCLCRNLS